MRSNKKPDIWKVNEEIRLGDFRSVRAYMIAERGIDIDYSKKPKEHIPWPTQAVQYTRLSSKEQMEPLDEEDRRQKAQATILLNELRNRIKHMKDDDARAYTIDYITSIVHYGQRVLDKVKDARREFEELEKESKTWSGVGKRIADILGFRIGSGAGAYYIFEGPWADVEFEVPGTGLSFKGKDAGEVVFATIFAVASAISYSWGAHKRRKIMKWLKKELDKVYREAIDATIENLRCYFPETIIEVEVEDILDMDEASKMLMKKYIYSNRW